MRKQTDEKVEHLQNYRGQTIMIIRVTLDGNRTARVFKYGNLTFGTIEDAKAFIDEEFSGVQLHQR